MSNVRIYQVSKATIIFSEKVNEITEHENYKDIVNSLSYMIISISNPEIDKNFNDDMYKEIKSVLKQVTKEYELTYSEIVKILSDTISKLMNRLISN